MTNLDQYRRLIETSRPDPGCAIVIMLTENRVIYSQVPEQEGFNTLAALLWVYDPDCDNDAVDFAVLTRE